MPATTGLSIVVVVHLDPTHESLMPELLAKLTTLRVLQAQVRQREPSTQACVLGTHPYGHATPPRQVVAAQFDSMVRRAQNQEGFAHGLRRATDRRPHNVATGAREKRNDVRRHFRWRAKHASTATRTSRCQG